MNSWHNEGFIFWLGDEKSMILGGERERGGNVKIERKNEVRKEKER